VSGQYVYQFTSRKQKVTENPDLLLDRIGMRVLARRKELGLTQEDLAARLGISGPNIGRIERGAPNVTVRMLCRVAEALETTVQDLMFGAPPSR
jgi:transcriptional regulator with XRE-family HTH domain